MKSLLILFAVLAISFGMTVSTPEISDLINHVIEEVKPCRVTLYATNKVSNNKYYRLIFKSLIKKIPTVAISLDRQPSFLNYNMDGYYQYNNNISAPLHFIVLQEIKQNEHMNQLERLFWSIDKSLMYLTTTKICLILFPTTNSFSAVVNKMLYESYEYKYDDFIIVSINHGIPMIINH